MNDLEEIFKPSDCYPLGKPYDESLMQEIIKKMMAQQLKNSEKYNIVEVSLQKPPPVSWPFSTSSSRFQTSFGEYKYRLVNTLRIKFNLFKCSCLLR